MRVSTYALESQANGGRSYLTQVRALVEEVLEMGEPFRALTAAYGQYVAQTTRVDSPSHEESLLELLMLGVLWLARGHESLTGSPAQHDLVVELVRERRAGAGKRRDGSQNRLLSFDTAHERGSSVPSLCELQRLNDWLLATGEYDDEVKRLGGWLDFLSQPDRRSAAVLERIVGFARDFEGCSLNRLGSFTEQVDRFLQEQLPLRRQREDAAQCSRRRLEYHLNMAGAELLNRAWQKEFLACTEQIVVLPGCVRASSHPRCSAIRTETELRCTHCRNDCLVSRATQLASSYGKPTVAVIHGSDFSRFLEAALARGNHVGIIGVACAPGILGAGFRAKALGLPAQCVLLDASGCEHWLPESTPTAFDLGELERILLGRGTDVPRLQSCVGFP